MSKNQDSVWGRKRISTRKPARIVSDAHEKGMGDFIDFLQKKCEEKDFNLEIQTLSGSMDDNFISDFSHKNSEDPDAC